MCAPNQWRFSKTEREDSDEKTGQIQANKVQKADGPYLGVVAWIDSVQDDS